MNKNVKKVMMILFLVGFTFVVLSGNVFAADVAYEPLGGGTSCGATATNCGGVCLPNALLSIIRIIVNIIKIGVPIILIILGMIDMGKAVASQKDDEIKKGQKIAQLVINEICYCKTKEVKKMSETSRGEGGFGSTGLGKNKKI